MFISYEQAYGGEILQVLENQGVMGFTKWAGVQGRGTESGLPHYGDHAWPSLNDAVLTVIPDEKVDAILAELKDKDEQTPNLGLRAFVWNVEGIY